MRQMGANIIQTRHSTLIQMGSNEGLLNTEFLRSTQLGDSDVRSKQIVYTNEQQQKPHTENDAIREQQARLQQIQM